MMKTILFSLFMLLLAGSAEHDDVMRKDGDTYIVNTTTICDRKGYKDITPLEVYIRKGKVVKIVALDNKESKGYFNPMTRRLFPLYENLKLSKAKSLSKEPSVDATTGATFSGKAVQANINSALHYYESH